MKKSVVLFLLAIMVSGCAQTVEISDFTPLPIADYDGSSAVQVSAFNTSMGLLTAKVKRKADALNPLISGDWWWDFCTASFGVLGSAITASYSLASKPVQARNAGVITGIVVGLSTGLKAASQISANEKAKSDDLSNLKGVLDYARTRFQALDPALRAGGDPARLASAVEELSQLNLMLANAVSQ
ncbi:MAG: hypothetical protein ACLP05_07040 [Candidatus Kryptoniota bacterium]